MCVAEVKRQRGVRRVFRFSRLWAEERWWTSHQWHPAREKNRSLAVAALIGGTLSKRMRMEAWVAKRARRWVRRTIVVMAVVLALSTLVLALALECRPSWYHPPLVSDEVVRRAKIESAELAEFMGTHLVAGEAFDAVITQASINEMVAALPVISPEAAERVPRPITQFGAAFEAGRLRAGVLADHDGWRAIVSVEVGIEVGKSTDDIVVSLRDVRIGAVGMPRWALRRVFDERLRTLAARTTRGEEAAVLGRQADSVDALLEGVRIRNRFVWPNGRRAFRVEGITMERGEARVRIQPL